MSLYNLRMLAPNKYAMAKFSADDFNVEAVYNLEPRGAGYTCDCPANARSVVLKPCKHKRMIPLMLGAVNTDRFYDPETRSWCQPLAGPTVDEQQVNDALTDAVEAEGRQGSEQVPEDAETAQQRTQMAEEHSATKSPPAASSNGRTSPFEGENVGSSPTAVAKPAAAPTIRRR